MKRLLTALAFAATTIAHAACGVNVHLGAWHSEPGFESSTPGLGLVCDTRFEDTRAAAGVFRNSLRRTSVYVGAAWEPLRYGPLQLGIFGGLITGYREGPIPMAAGLVSWHISPKTDAHFTVLPSVKGLTPVTIALSIERRF